VVVVVVLSSSGLYMYNADSFDAGNRCQESGAVGVVEGKDYG
jgi:hypothetical protein